MFGGIFHHSGRPIGLDMGTRSIRLLQLHSSGDGFKAAAAATMPIPPELTASTKSAESDASAPVRAEGLARLLKQMLASAPFVGRKVVATMPPGDVVYKNLRLPVMPPDELDKVVAWDAADRLNLKADDYRFQYFNAGEVRQGDESRLEVILMAAKMASVSRLVELLNMAQLEPVAIDAEASALARCLAPPPATPDPEAPATVVLDVGYGTSKVQIVRSGRVMFVKPIDIGGRHFDAIVAQHLNLPESEAADLRRRLHSSSGEGEQAEQPLFGSTRRESVQRAVYEGLRSTAGDMAREVGLCLRYYSVTFRGKRPDKVLLVGGEAHEPQLAKVLAEEAGIVCEIADPLAGVDLTSVRDVISAQHVPSAWAVAAGLAMRPQTSRSVRRAA